MGGPAQAGGQADPQEGRAQAQEPYPIQGANREGDRDRAEEWQGSDRDKGKARGQAGSRSQAEGEITVENHGGCGTQVERESPSGSSLEEAEDNGGVSVDRSGQERCAWNWKAEGGRGPDTPVGWHWQIRAERPAARGLLPVARAQDADHRTLSGGGVSGQAGALRHGLARALIELDPSLRPQLKAEGLLTRDAREKERRKYGLKKARKAPQYSKR